jgi:hypothetical protein
MTTDEDVEKALSKIANTPYFFDVDCEGGKEYIMGDGSAGYFREVVAEIIAAARASAVIEWLESEDALRFYMDRKKGAFKRAAIKLRERK